jgi:hypothetical protein
VFVLRDGIDGEVAPRQILFKRYRRIGLEHEAVIPAAGLAFGARQRVLLAAARMQEDRKILADGPIALRHECFGRGADHHVIAIHHRSTQQSIANRAAD